MMQHYYNIYVNVLIQFLPNEYDLSAKQDSYIFPYGVSVTT